MNIIICAESDVKEIVYFKSSYTTRLGNIEEPTKLFDEREKLYATEDTPFVPYADTFKVETNEKSVIYVRIMDKEGNVTYISSDGMVVYSVVLKVVKITTNADANKKIQNRSVTFEVEIKDYFAEDETFLEIKRIYYVVSRNGQSYKELHSSFTDTITVKAKIK